MGVSRSGSELVGKLRNVEKGMSELGTRKDILPVANAVKGEMLRSAGQAGFRPGSRIAGRPWRGVYVRSHSNKALAVGYAPPAHLVNNRTKAHAIGARGLGSKKAITQRVQGASLIGALTGSSVSTSFRPRGKGAKALHWGDNFAAYVRSPGTRGKRFFERSKAPAARAAGIAATSVVAGKIARGFGSTVQGRSQAGLRGTESD